MSNLIKRTVLILLVLVICISCLVSPASASSFDNGFFNFYNLLDYDNADGDNILGVDSNLVANFDYTLPVKSIVNYIDVVVSSSSGTITSAYGGRVGYAIDSTGKSQLNVESIGTRLFRVYGTVPQYTYDEFELTLIGSASNTIFTIQSFLVTNERITTFKETGSFSIQEQSGQTYTYTQSEYRDLISHNIFVNTNYRGSRSIQVVLRSDNWKKYDFLEFEIHADVSDITSIFAWVDNISIPFNVSYLGDPVDFESSSVDSLHDFLITVDLRGVDRTADTNTFGVCIDAELPWAQGGSFGLGVVHGIILQETYDTQTFYFRNILEKLELFRSNFFTIMGSLQSNLSTWFTDLGNYIGDLLVTLNNNMNAGFTNIATKLNTLLTNLGIWFNDLSGIVSSGFSNTWNKLETGFNNMVTGFQDVGLLLNSIWMKIDDLIRGTTEQNQNAEDFNDTVDDQAGELDDLTGDLNSVTRPPLDDVDVSINGMVDPNVVILSTGGLTSVLSNSIILRLLIMSLTFALAGFILFGKR